MKELLGRLGAAARWGAVLAVGTGCGGEVTAGTATGAGGTSAAGSGGATTGGSDGGGTGGKLADAAADRPEDPREPYPDAAACTDTAVEGGFTGPCCEQAGCIDRSDGGCPDPEEARYRLGQSGGNCVCGPAATGPYRPRDPATEADCCYLYSMQWCMGRPLAVAGVVRVAPPRRRVDWGRARPESAPPWELAA